MSKLVFVLLIGLVLAAQCYSKRPASESGERESREEKPDSEEKGPKGKRPPFDSQKAPGKGGSFQKENGDDAEKEINVNVNVRVGEPGQGRPQWFGHRAEREDSSSEENGQGNGKPSRPTRRPAGNESQPDPDPTQRPPFNGTRPDKERPPRPSDGNDTRPGDERPGPRPRPQDERENDCDKEREDKTDRDVAKPTRQRENSNGGGIDVNVNVRVKQGGDKVRHQLSFGNGRDPRPGRDGPSQDKDKNEMRPKPSGKNESSSEQSE